MSRETGSGFAEPVAHVDMDAFFVEVERLDEPSLRGRAVVVGGLGSRGVVASASYEARRRGVTSAMPVAHARRRCPHAVYLAPRHRRYAEVSSRIFEVLASFTPVVEKLSIDEAFLDLSGLRLHFPDPVAVGEAIRTRIRDEIGVPASVGIATTKLLAKLASEAAKPDGLLLVAAGTELEFLHPLSVRRLWGVGEATHAVLEAMDVRTIGDLAAVPSSVLEKRLGPTMGGHLLRLANGEDGRPVENHDSNRSISVEETFANDVADQEGIERAALELCDRLAGRLRRAEAAGRTVTMKMRFADFTTITRSETVPERIRTTGELWIVVQRLLERSSRGARPIRLLGVGVSALEETSAPEQLALSSPPSKAAFEAAEQVRDRFGDGALRPARLVIPPRTGDPDVQKTPKRGRG